MFEFTRNFYSPTEEGSESSFTPGQIIIPEQTVEASSSRPGARPSSFLISDFNVAPDNLLINFNGTDYEVKVVKDGDFYTYAYPLGELDDILFEISLSPPKGWAIITHDQGTYTVSAKIPEAKSKVFAFPKGRTIVSELSRLNKAFGNISKKQTIIGQLSDIADAAEAGKIGGGSGGALMVHVNGKDTRVLDKTWQEIYDALKATSVYIIRENEEEMSVSTQERIIEAYNNPGGYGVHTSLDNYYTTASPDDYPAVVGK